MGKMQLPLDWTFGVRATTPDELLMARENDFDFVDLDFNHRSNIVEHREALKELGTSCGLFFTAHGAGSSFDRGDGFQETLQDIETAAGFNPLSFTIHPIYYRRRFTEEQLGDKLQKIARLVAAAASCGFPIAVENIVEQPEDFVDLFEAMRELRLVLDIGHAELVLESPQNKSFGFVKRWFPRLVHIHVHDNMGGNSVRDDLHLEVGHGKIDFQAIIGEVARCGYQGTLLFEMDVQSAKRSRETIVSMLRTALER